MNTRSIKGSTVLLSSFSTGSGSYQKQEVVTRGGILRKWLPFVDETNEHFRQETQKQGAGSPIISASPSLLSLASSLDCRKEINCTQIRYVMVKSSFVIPQSDLNVQSYSSHLYLLPSVPT